MRIVQDKTFLNIHWMKRFNDNKHEEGVDAFLRYADINPIHLPYGMLHCPCSECRNKNMFDQSVMHQHLLRRYFDKDYTCWDCYEGTTYMVEDTMPL